MPPSIKVSKEEILSKAVEIVWKDGIEALNARRLSKELNCSVHPIFRAYESMEELNKAVYYKVCEMYNREMLLSLKNPLGFLGTGLAYVNFAREHKNLFKLIFMTEIYKEESPYIMLGDKENLEVVKNAASFAGLDIESAKQLYTSIWLTAHGIASLLATGKCDFTEEEVKSILINSFDGLALNFKNKSKEEQI